MKCGGLASVWIGGCSLVQLHLSFGQRPGRTGRGACDTVGFGTLPAGSVGLLSVLIGDDKHGTIWQTEIIRSRPTADSASRSPNQYEKPVSSGSERFEFSPAEVVATAEPDWTCDWFADLYEDLRTLAHAQRRRFRDPNAPGTTSIVHEAFERLYRAPNKPPEQPLHFYRTAARAMRSVLIDNARRARAAIHGGDLKRAPSELLELVSVQRTDELLALDDALERLYQADPALGELVQLRVFGGLTIDELAELLDVSAATVKRRWKTACAWLFDELEPDG